MSSYSKTTSSFQKHKPYQKPQRQQGTDKDVSDKEQTSTSTKVVQNKQASSANPITNTKSNSKLLPPNRNTVTSSIVTTPFHLENKLDKQLTSTAAKTNTTVPNAVKTLKSAFSGTPSKTINIHQRESVGVRSTSGGNKFYLTNNKWKRNNYLIAGGGYPGRFGISSNLPYFTGHTSPVSAAAVAGLYYHPFYQPHFASPTHPQRYPHHLQNHHRFVPAASPVPYPHLLHQKGGLRGIGPAPPQNARRSRSAHGSFRSKPSSSSAIPQCQSNVR